MAEKKLVVYFSLAAIFFSRPAKCLFFKSIVANYFMGEDYGDNFCQETCQMSLTCWMSGGRVKESQNCRSFLHICCTFQGINGTRHGQYAEPRKLTNWDFGGLNSIELVQDIHYGSVKNDPMCGLRKIASRRVVGGSDAGFGTFPWQALIRIRKARCGGALIGRQHVVTAGHCVHTLANFFTPLTGVRVYLGEYTLYSESEPLPRQRFSVDSVHVHPYYKFTPQADRFDVAVLRLNRKVRYEPHIAPVCLPMTGDWYAEDTKAMVAGWGATKPESKVRPHVLQAVDVNVVASQRCEKWHRSNGINLRIYDDMLCAGHKDGGKDACQGDSGGPLMTTRRTDRRWVLIGLVSAGYSCAKPRQPGIYHRVAKSADWISYVMHYKTR